MYSNGILHPPSPHALFQQGGWGTLTYSHIQQDVPLHQGTPNTVPPSGITEILPPPPTSLSSKALGVHVHVQCHRPLSQYAPVTIGNNFESQPERRKYSKCTKSQSLTLTWSNCLCSSNIHVQCKWSRYIQWDVPPLQGTQSLSAVTPSTHRIQALPHLRGNVNTKLLYTQYLCTGTCSYKEREATHISTRISPPTTFQDSRAWKKPLNQTPDISSRWTGICLSLRLLFSLKPKKMAKMRLFAIWIY